MGRKKRAGNGNGSGGDGGRKRRFLLTEKRQEMIISLLPTVQWMALKLVSRLPNNVQVNDLINAGVIGLIDAVDKFDPDRGVKFESYANIRIRGAMLDEIRSMDWVPRSLRQKSHRLEKLCLELKKKLGRSPTDEEIAREMKLSMDEYYSLLDEIKGIFLIPEDIQDIIRENRSLCLMASESNQPFTSAYHSELKEILETAIKDLPEKEQLVLSLYYYEELTMKEIGVVMQLAESRISQIHQKAILNLRTKLKSIRSGVVFKKEDLPFCIESLNYSGKNRASNY